MERARRCRVITPQNANAKAHLDPKFAQAPFVHPFNQPKYYAQLLHAITFAKATGKKILWLVAHDVPHDSAGQGTETLRKQQQQWLQLHDRSTAGTLGMLPLIEDMPIRFTETYDRKQSALKHATATLLGWGLSPRDIVRVEATDAAEAVLLDCPTFLQVRLTNPPASLPEGKLDLRPYKRTWKVGRTHVHRRGFQIAPDFAGTAHAFCGSTLSACKGDFLHWSATPTPESMLRAYIIRSRVRSTDDILLVQPYSPQLFRQVKLPGPALLLARQSGALSDQTSIQVYSSVISNT